MVFKSFPFKKIGKSILISEEHLFVPIKPEKIKISAVAFIKIQIVFFIMTNYIGKKLHPIKKPFIQFVSEMKGKLYIVELL